MNVIAGGMVDRLCYQDHSVILLLLFRRERMATNKGGEKVVGGKNFLLFLLRLSHYWEVIRIGQKWMEIN